MFQTIDRNTEAELERLTRNAKQMTDQLHATHITDVRALEKRLKADEVSASIRISSHFTICF